MTDANLVLGYINPEALCGGEFKLTTQGVREAILEQIGKPLGLDVVEAAHGIFRIVNANMANAIRRVSSEAGFDPRDFRMVVYGGNGPVHAAMQADELGIRELLVPKTSPAFSALGLLLADYVVDTLRSYITPSGRAQADRINELFAEMEQHAEHELRAAGLSRGDLVFHRFLNLCYPGQTFDMAVPAVTRRATAAWAPEELARTVEAFHDLHEELHAYAVRDEEPVIRAVRVQTIGQTAKPSLREYPARQHARRAARCARGDRPSSPGASRIRPSTTARRSAHGHRIEGPAIVEERFTTIVIYPGQTRGARSLRQLPDRAARTDPGVAVPGVAIAGIGQVEFSKKIGRSERQIALEAIRLALGDAGLLPSQVDGLVRFDMESTSEVEIARNLGIPNLRFFGEVGYGGGGGCAAVGHAAMAIEIRLGAHGDLLARAQPRLRRPALGGNRRRGGRRRAVQHSLRAGAAGRPDRDARQTTHVRVWHHAASSWAPSRSPSASTPRAIPTR